MPGGDVEVSNWSAHKLKTLIYFSKYRAQKIYPASVYFVLLVSVFSVVRFSLLYCFTFVQFKFLFWSRSLSEIRQLSPVWSRCFAVHCFPSEGGGDLHLTGGAVYYTNKLSKKVNLIDIGATIATRRWQYVFYTFLIFFDTYQTHPRLKVFKHVPSRPRKSFWLKIVWNCLVAFSKTFRLHIFLQEISFSLPFALLINTSIFQSNCPLPLLWCQLLVGNQWKNKLWSYVAKMVKSQGNRSLSSMRNFDFKKYSPRPKKLLQAS